MMFIFTGCVTSSLSLDKNKELVLKYNSDAIVLSHEVLDSKFLNFKDLYVSIYKLKSKDSRVLFYERASTDQSFEFKYDGLYTVMYVFNNRVKYEEVYRRNNLKLLQLQLKDKRYLNVMVQASDTQNYSFTYGFSNKEFMKIANKIKVKDEDKLLVLKHEALTFTKESKSLSDWNDTLVFFTPLIIPLRGMFGR